MKKKWKILVLLIFLILIVALANLYKTLVFLEWLWTSGNLWIILVLIVLAPFIYWAFVYFNLKSRLAIYNRTTKDRHIPQEERLYKIMPDFIERNWRSRTAGKAINLVNNYITPWREDSRKIEMALYTTSKAYAEQRITEEDIPEKQRFYVFIDCFNGECFTLDYMNNLKFREAIDFVDRYWQKTIKQKVLSPIERKVQDALAMGTGMEMAKDKEPEKNKETEEKK